MSDANVSIIIDRLVEADKMKPLIAVCPNESGIGPKYDWLLRDIVPFVDRTFRTMQGRESRAIAGHSVGGFDSIYLTLTHPELFSVAGGFGSDLAYLQSELDKQMSGHDYAASPVRFWLYVGRHDEFGTTQPNRDYAKHLKEIGFPVFFVEDDGTHGSNVAQRLSDFLEYLSQNLKW